MHGSFADSPFTDRMGARSFAEYSRIPIEQVEPDNPVGEFNTYYRTLADQGLPRWEDFDICAVPKHVVACIALGRPEYASPGDSVPDHFVYTLEGGAVRQLVGSSVIGKMVGRVVRISDKHLLLQEIDDALEDRKVISSLSDLQMEGRPNLRFTRGVFLFSSADRPIGRLAIVIYKQPITVRPS